FVAIQGAVPGDVIDACQQVIWDELGQQGVTDDPATWTAPVVRISCPEGGPFVDAGTRPAVREACDQLIGGLDRWWRGRAIPIARWLVIDSGSLGVSGLLLTTHSALGASAGGRGPVVAALQLGQVVAGGARRHRDAARLERGRLLVAEHPDEVRA